MKKLLVAASVLAALASTPALADGNNRGTDKEVFKLRANNPAKCNLEAANGYAIRLPGNSISTDDGFARPDLSATVAAELNNAGVTAWCTGASNTLQMYRTPFTTDGGIKGGADNDDFNRAVIYDVAMTIVGAVRSDGVTPTEGTSDGQNNGPGVGTGPGLGLTVGRFGPTLANAVVNFDPENGNASTAVTDGTGAGATTSYTEDSNRLIAGRYDSTLTIELTPGV